MSYHDIPAPTDPETLEGLETLAQGQAHDLKVDRDGCRIWLSRCDLEDGETHRVYVEHYRDGRWTVTDRLYPY